MRSFVGSGWRMPIYFDVGVAVDVRKGVELLIVEVSQSPHDFTHVQLYFLVVKITLKQMGLLIVHDFLDLSKVALHDVSELLLLMQAGSQIFQFILYPPQPLFNCCDFLLIRLLVLVSLYAMSECLCLLLGDYDLVDFASDGKCVFSLHQLLYSSKLSLFLYQQQFIQKHSLYQLRKHLCMYWKTQQTGKRSTVLSTNCLASQYILDPTLILQKGLAEALKAGQDSLWIGGALGSGFVVSACSEAEAALPRLTVVLHFSLHEHHACPLPSEGLAGIETSTAAIAATGLGLLRSLFEERDFTFVERKGGGRRSQAGDSEGLDVLSGFFVSIGILAEQLIEPVPIVERWVCLGECGQEHSFDESTEKGHQFLVNHQLNQYYDLLGKEEGGVGEQGLGELRIEYYIMSVRQRIDRQDKIEISINWAKHWQAIVDSLPQIIKSPSKMAQLGLWAVVLAIKLAVFAILMGQTAHILTGSQKRHINLRHLLIKWVILVGVMELTAYVQRHTSYDQLFALFAHSLLLLFITPSKFIKNLHLKYFSISERKKLDESEGDPANYEMTLSSRILVSLTLFCLNTSRLMITFVPPGHRKRIEEAMKGVNMVIVEEKYFWKLYESNWNNSPIQQGNEAPTAPITPKNANLKNSALLRAESFKRDSVLRAKASEYIQIVINSTTAGGGRKFTFYRDVQIVYNLETSELTIISEEDSKATSHILTEIFMVEDSMIELTCEEEEESIFIKFKLKKDMDTFVHSIEQIN